MADSHRLITVFGGTGFLGQAIVRALIEAGRSVRIAARHPKLPDWYQVGDPITLVEADILDEESVKQAVQGATGVANAVSLYVQKRHIRFSDIHVDGAGRIARRAREAGVSQLVQISGIGADTQSPSAYIRARAQGEAAVLEHFPKATILRPSVMFGPDGAFLSSLSQLTRLPLIPLFGKGETRLQPVHVDDVARAVERALSPRPPERRFFELGGREVMTYRQIITQVLAHRHRQRPLIPVPFLAWHLLASLAQRLPSAPLTHDQIFLMQQDNSVSENVGTFEELGIMPRLLSDYLSQCSAQRTSRNAE
ncbi:complex I NDUFA9 subunit family protein [Halomonas sp. Bachu 37]|uniref:complex I NDUFA9 subunit family protein n=1 Tax=Halomonas kashgarensis TaxID=3084920 RepID=UPI00321694FD